MSASSLYAYAGLVEGHPYVKVTPSPGSALGGLRDLADPTPGNAFVPGL
jgi:myo-inositol-1-phosphate synthase